MHSNFLFEYYNLYYHHYYRGLYLSKRALLSSRDKESSDGCTITPVGTTNFGDKTPTAGAPAVFGVEGKAPLATGGAATAEAAAVDAAIDAGGACGGGASSDLGAALVGGAESTGGAMIVFGGGIGGPGLKGGAPKRGGGPPKPGGGPPKPGGGPYP